MPPAKTINLADLSDEDRARLLADARAEQEEAVSEEAIARTDRIAAHLRDRDHLDGCPIASGSMPSIGRVEAYGQTKPPDRKTGEPAKAVTVVRCVECGGSVVKPMSFDAFELQLLERDDDPDPDDL